MAGQEVVSYIWHLPLDSLLLSWLHRRRLRQVLTVSSPHGLHTDKHLISVWTDVDELHDEIRIRSVERHLEVNLQRTFNLESIRQYVSGLTEDIAANGSEPLVTCHIVPIPSSSILMIIRDRIGGIGSVFIG